MSILGNDLLLGSGDEGYNLTRSLRFRSSASAYLNKTFSTTATSRQKITISAWVKRGALGAISGSIIEGDQGATYYSSLFFTNDLLYVAFGGSSPYYVATTQVFRDPSAWYHIVASIDSTQATASNRVIIYVNGVQITALSIANYPPQNSNFGWLINATGNKIGSNAANSASFFDGYIAEMNVIDGQALTPSSFGSTNTLTGVWQPARYGGTYGTNGFYLPFTDNSALTTSSNVGLGKDFSGNGNYWTTNNISITAGTTYDSMTDVPTLTSATAANYCVGNPLSVGANTSLTNANLSGTLTGSGGWAGTICGLTSGKWYWEATPTANSGNSMWVGFLSDAYTKNDNAWSYSTQTALYANDGRNGNNASYGATWTTNDVIGIALDLSTSSGSITFYKNGVSQGVMFSSLTTSAVWRPLISGGGTGTTIAMNFGQRPFAYTPPTGYVALNTYNLPTSTIVKGNTVMDATTYTGNNSTNAIVNAAGFKPDLIWIKDRSRAGSHLLVDSVRGITKALSSDGTWSENTYSFSQMSSINSNGFTLTANTTSDNFYVNVNADTFVGWQWQAGQGTTSSNTSGSITSTVSVNASAGFSVVTYTGTGANATVGHGLGVAPSLIIVKRRDASAQWNVYHSSIGATGRLYLDATDATNTSSAPWNNTAPTSSVFTVGTATDTNASGSAIVAYCWTPIAGYSAFGSYTGNGSTDGPMVYTGFKPRFLLIKKTATGGGARGWLMEDTARSPYNAAELFLYANTSDAESNNQQIDFLSNGFKIRNNGLVVNDSGVTMIYAAFSSNPFKNSLAQ